MWEILYDHLCGGPYDVLSYSYPFLASSRFKSRPIHASAWIYTCMLFWYVVATIYMYASSAQQREKLSITSEVCLLQIFTSTPDFA